MQPAYGLHGCGGRPSPPAACGQGSIRAAVEAVTEAIPMEAIPVALIHKLQGAEQLRGVQPVLIFSHMESTESLEGSNSLGGQQWVHAEDKPPAGEPLVTDAEEGWEGAPLITHEGKPQGDGDVRRHYRFRVDGIK